MTNVVDLDILDSRHKLWTSRWFVPVPDGEIDLSHGHREEPPAWSVASLIGIRHPLAWEVDLLRISMQIITVALAMRMPWSAELQLG